ncbi:DUF2071 domain-containing protein [Streptomyces sp. NPDC003393]
MVGRTGFGLPYAWSKMEVHRESDNVSYTSQQRRPGLRGALSRLVVRADELIENLRSWSTC